MKRFEAGGREERPQRSEDAPQRPKALGIITKFVDHFGPFSGVNCLKNRGLDGQKGTCKFRADWPDFGACQKLDSAIKIIRFEYQIVLIDVIIRTN